VRVCCVRSCARVCCMRTCARVCCMGSCARVLREKMCPCVLHGKLCACVLRGKLCAPRPLSSPHLSSTPLLDTSPRHLSSELSPLLAPSPRLLAPSLLPSSLFSSSSPMNSSLFPLAYLFLPSLPLLIFARCSQSTFPPILHLLLSFNCSLRVRRGRQIMVGSSDYALDSKAESPWPSSQFSAVNTTGFRSICINAVLGWEREAILAQS
jgi:hypothetical protein